MQFGVTQRSAVPRPQNLDGLCERMSVVEQPFECDGSLAEALCGARRPPTAPLFVTVIEGHSLDDRGKVGPERASPLEFPEDGVVAVHEAGADNAREFLQLRRRQAPSTARCPCDPVNQIEMVNEQSLIVHEVRLGETLADYQ